MKNNMNHNVSRKDFLKRSAVFGAAGLTAAAMLGYCGRRPEEEGEDEVAAPATSACEDVSSLSPGEKQQRDTMVKNLKYVSKSPEAARNCANCQLYKAPAGGAACGGCQLFPGPVAPGGWCASWAPKVG